MTKMDRCGTSSLPLPPEKKKIVDGDPAVRKTS